MSYLETVQNQAAQSISPNNIAGLLNAPQQSSLQTYAVPAVNVSASVPVVQSTSMPVTSLLEAEKRFLECMAWIREIGDRNIYGSRCTIFYPPMGLGYFNSDVALTYYEMYKGILQGSNALDLLAEWLDESYDFVKRPTLLTLLKWVDMAWNTITKVQNNYIALGDFSKMNPTLAFLANQNYQGALTVAYIFGK